MTGRLQLAQAPTCGSRSIGPPVQLLLVLLLQAEDDLDGAGALRDFATLGDHDVRGVSSTAVSRVLRSCQSDGYSLEDVGCHVLSSDGVLGDTLLVAAHLRMSSDIAVPAISPRGTLTSVRTCRVRLLILLRPSETTQTTTFFQPSGPHIFDLFLLHKCATFLSTLQTKC